MIKYYFIALITIILSSVMIKCQDNVNIEIENILKKSSITDELKNKYKSEILKIYKSGLNNTKNTDEFKNNVVFDLKKINSKLDYIDDNNLKMIVDNFRFNSNYDLSNKENRIFEKNYKKSLLNYCENQLIMNFMNNRKIIYEGISEDERLDIEKLFDGYKKLSVFNFNDQLLSDNDRNLLFSDISCSIYAIQYIKNVFRYMDYISEEESNYFSWNINVYNYEKYIEKINSIDLICNSFVNDTGFIFNKNMILSLWELLRINASPSRMFTQMNRQNAVYSNIFCDNNLKFYDNDSKMDKLIFDEKSMNEGINTIFLNKDFREIQHAVFTSCYQYFLTKYPDDLWMKKKFFKSINSFISYGFIFNVVENSKISDNDKKEMINSLCIEFKKAIDSGYMSENTEVSQINLIKKYYNLCFNKIRCNYIKAKYIIHQNVTININDKEYERIFDKYYKYYVKTYPCFVTQEFIWRYSVNKSINENFESFYIFSSIYSFIIYRYQMITEGYKGNIFSNFRIMDESKIQFLSNLSINNFVCKIDDEMLFIFDDDKSKSLLLNLFDQTFKRDVKVVPFSKVLEDSIIIKNALFYDVKKTYTEKKI